MPGATTRLGLPYPLPGDPYKPASVDLPALANAIDAVAAVNPQAVLSAQQILDVGIVGQIRAGRALGLADLTTLLGMSAPIGLYPLPDVNDVSGSTRTLTNKGAVPFGVGINGLAATAAVFAGSSAQALYLADTGGADPFRVRSGSIFAWVRTAKQGATQIAVSKYGATAGVSSFALGVDATNVARAVLTDGVTVLTLLGASALADDRWHFVALTFSGSLARLYVDGALEASGGALAAALNSTASAPLNIGGMTADGSTAATSPFFGRVANAGITPDVLGEDALRLLMCAKVAHGLSYTPTRAHLVVTRRRRGGALVTGDFPATPKVLYNFTAGALTDAGSLGSGLVNNAGSVSVAGGDGLAAGAYVFAAGASQYLSGTDTGLPTTAKTVTAWARTTAAASGSVVAYGAVTAGAGILLYVDAAGLPSATDGTTTIAGAAPINDGALHHLALVQDGSAADGVKWKLYVDGKLVAGSTASVGTVTLAGAGGLRIGRDRGANTNYFTGLIDGVAISDTALTASDVRALYAKGSGSLGPSPLDAGAHVEAADATNVYVLHDTLPSTDLVDLKAAA